MRSIIASCAVVAALLAGPPAAPTGAGPPALPLVAASDRPVAFMVAGTITYGTVHVPVHRAGLRLPAALLLPGSGPTDRNGDQLPDVAPHTMARVAAALGADGMMTLRFDKYASGQTGIGMFWSHPQDLDYPAVVRQAIAAYAALRAQPEANPAALSLVGHSEGGLTAMLVAQQVSPRPAGIALLAPQSLRLLDHIQAQIGRQLAAAVRARQLTAARQRQITAAMVRAVVDLRAHRPVDPARLPAEVSGIFTILQGTNLRYTFSDDALDPAGVARRVPVGIRALLACGGADVQVTCAETTGIVTAWRGRTTGQGRLVLPGVGHFLSVAAHPFILAPSVLAALHDFAAPGPRPALS
jgi:hypothetical protein